MRKDFEIEDGRKLWRAVTNWIIDTGWAIKAGTPDARIKALEAADEVVAEFAAMDGPPAES